MTTTNNKTFASILTSANNKIFNWDLEKIIEVTYTYEKLSSGILFNVTLFEEFLNYKQRENIDFIFLKKAFNDEINKRLVFIKKLLSNLKYIEWNTDNEKIQKSILSWTLKYVQNILKLSKNWFIFELEKAWYEHNLSEEDVHKLVVKNESLDKKAFWIFVKDMWEELLYLYNFLKNHHDEKKHALSSSNKRNMDKYLKSIFLSLNSYVWDTVSFHRKFLRWSFMKNLVHRKNYTKIFDMICDFYGLPQRTKVTRVWSIYDWDKYLEIPWDKEHEYLSVERILKLISHEIDSHYINSYNWKILLWNFRWADNLPKEEWLAIFMEKIFVWYDLENRDSFIEYLFVLLAWEILPWDDFKDFLRIVSRDYKLKRSYTKTFNRSKRNYSFNYRWVQHKDIVYFLWLKDVINYLKDGWDFRKLFLWKVSFKDIDKLFKLYKNSNKHVIFPIFFSDIIYYSFSSKLKDKDFNFDVNSFYFYLKKKYWFLDFDCFEIEKHILSKEKKLRKIVSYFEKYALNKD